MINEGNTNWLETLKHAGLTRVQTFSVAQCLIRYSLVALRSVLCHKASNTKA